MLTASGYIAVDEFKALNPHLDLTLYNDATISGLIHAATRTIDLELGYTLPIESIVGEKIKATVNTAGELELWTRKFPIREINALTIKEGDVSINLALGNNYDIPANSSPPAVYCGFDYITRNDYFVVVDYRAGYETIPFQIKQAASLLVKSYMAERYNPGGFEDIRQGQVAFSATTNLLRKEAFDILSHYKRTWSF